MRCAECIFYYPLDDQRGECRESPPKSFVVPVQTMAGQGIGFQAVFPQCATNVWCGAFEPSLVTDQAPH